MRKNIIVWWIVCGAAVAVTVTCVVNLFRPATISPTLVAERAAARSAGIPVAVAELRKPLPPADQNAALFYESMPTRNSQNPHDKTEDNLTSLLTKQPAQISANDWQAVRKLLAEEAPLLQGIHAAARQPYCVFARNWDMPHPENMLFPEFAKIRRAARLLALESLLLAHDGHGVSAVANARLGYRLADHGESDPMLISYLVAVAIDGITTNALQNILLLDPSNAATLKAAQTVLTTDARVRSVKRGLGGEAAFDQSICESLRPEGIEGVRKFTASTGNPDDSSATPHFEPKMLFGKQFWSGVIDRNALELLRNQRALIAVCDKPYSESQPVAEQINKTVESSLNPGDFIAKILMPVFTELFKKRAQEADRIAVANAAAAALIYRQSHNGSLPAHLSDAMPTPPIDAFDGTPAIYAVSGNSFTITINEPRSSNDKPVSAHFSFP